MRNLFVFVILAAGCAGDGRTAATAGRMTAPTQSGEKPETAVRLAGHQSEQQAVSSEDPTPSGNREDAGANEDAVIEADAGTLAHLEAEATRLNPTLLRIRREYESVRARSKHVGELPDPMIGGNVFIAPIETAAGSQRANLTFSQKLPSLARLDAQAQQACLEAMTVQQVYLAERSKLISEIRVRWFRLYLIARRLESIRANQELLGALITVANSKVSTGKATHGDVLAGTVDLARLQEQVVGLRSERASTVAEINRLVGRDAATPVASPSRVAVEVSEWSHEMLRAIAWEHQPEIVAANIRTQATRWGLKVARLKRRPDLTLSASWFGIEGNRPAPSIVDVGRDAWAVGASVVLPINRDKYDAIEREAAWKYRAAHASVDVVKQRYDSLLRDLWSQATAARETVQLYEDSILPQARNTVEADQESYANGEVEFDRLIRNVRNLLTLEVGYHRAVSEAASALARIRHACGSELTEVAREPETFPIEFADDAESAVEVPALPPPGVDESPAK